MHPLACHHWSKLTVSAITKRQRAHQGHSRKKKKTKTVAPLGNFKVPGQVFLGGVRVLFLFNFFSRFIIFTFRNYSLQNCIMHLK